MSRRPPGLTPTDSLFPFTAVFRVWGCLLDRVADQVAERDVDGRVRRVHHQLIVAFQAQFQRLAAELGTVGVEQLLGDAPDVGGAVPALVARQQQQRADQVRALLLGALDAQQARLRLLVDSRQREQQLDCALHHRQWRAQLVADVGVELAVTHHHIGEALGVIVERGCKRSEEHTSELQSLMRISYAVFCLKKKNLKKYHQNYMNSIMT